MRQLVAWFGCWLIDHSYKVTWSSKAAIHGRCEDCGKEIQIERQDDGSWRDPDHAR